MSFFHCRFFSFFFFFSFIQVQSRLYPLPSAFQEPKEKKRKRSAACSTKSKVYTKDIVCIPHSLELPIAIPRGERRSELAEMGLIGKISLNSSWSVKDVQSEVSSVFAGAFGIPEGELLPYVYLRYTYRLFKRSTGSFNIFLIIKQ